MDLALSAAQQGLLDELRDWLSDHLTADFRSVRGRGGPDDDDAWEVRRAWEHALGAGNWLGVSWPTEFGGRGLSMVDELLVTIELAKAAPPARAAFHGETLLAPTLLTHGSREQKTAILPVLARGEMVWCQGYSEPGAGSDLANVAARAELDRHEWVIDGQKIWTTFAQHAEWMFGLFRTDPRSARHAGLSYLLVPMRQAEVEVRPIRTMLGDTGFNEVFFDRARTSRTNVVGQVGNGWRVAMATLGHERATSVLGYQYSFERELQLLIDLARASGAAADPHVRRKIAVAVTGLRIIGQTNARTVSKALAGGEFGPEASLGKLLWSRWHQQFTELALDLLGQRAQVTSDLGADGRLTDVELLRRAFLRARAETIYAGTTEIQLNIVAERVLGLPKDAVARGIA